MSSKSTRTPGNSASPPIPFAESDASLLRTRPSRDAASYLVYQLLILFNNLVHTLTRKFKLVCNKSKGLAASMQVNNSRVSIGVGLWTRAQRAPLPTWNCFNFCNSFRGEFSLAAALTQVTNPGTERQRGLVDIFDMGGGDKAVTLSSGELVNCCKGEVESRDVVHG